MIYKFTNRAKKVIEIANDISIELGHNYIGTEHILYGLVKEGEGIASKVLQNKGVTSEKVLKEINTPQNKESPQILILHFSHDNILHNALHQKAPKLYDAHHTFSQTNVENHIPDSFEM